MIAINATGESISYCQQAYSRGRKAVFDVTLTDSEFRKDFVNQREPWMQDSRLAEPDLEIDGLNQSLLSRLLSLLGLA